MLSWPLEFLSGIRKQQPRLSEVSLHFGIQIPVKGCPSNTQCLANLSNCVLFVSCQVLEHYPLLVSEFLWPAAVSPAGPGCNKPSLCSLPDDFALKLSQCAKDMKD